MILANLDALRATMQSVHDSGANLSLAWRLQQLKTLRGALLEFWDDFLDSLQDDLGKHKVESVMGELNIVLYEVDLAIRQVRKWMKPDRVAGPMALLPASYRIEKRPLLGPACLIIGPFNYPAQLTMLPLIGALAAGNPVVLKPSELAPKTSAVLEKALHKHFDASVVRVLNGGVPLTTELLKLPWGKIFFTGSERVGRIVALAAAQTLTPVVLELGGKSPVIIDETAPWDIQTVANRIVWGKFFNVGQTCVAPDYVLVHESKVEKLLESLVRTTEWQYGTNHRESELGRIVSETHALRLQKMIQEVEQCEETRMIVGKSIDCDPSDRYVCPTIIFNPPLKARLWGEEVFGPILPIRPFQTHQEAVDFVRSRAGTPLAAYVFTRYENVLQEYMRDIRTGAVFRNDVSKKRSFDSLIRRMLILYTCFPLRCLLIFYTY